MISFCIEKREAEKYGSAQLNKLIEQRTSQCALIFVNKMDDGSVEVKAYSREESDELHRTSFEYLKKSISKYNRLSVSVVNTNFEIYYQAPSLETPTILWNHPLPTSNFDIPQQLIDIYTKESRRTTPQREEAYQYLLETKAAIEQGHLQAALQRNIKVAQNKFKL
ncbi:MAG TPA: hypothetical protein VM577_20320 [Anaerovoracaceae bacterium]|nr:hypothetical protein [Anaerovoracaceae bacterium]